MLPSCVVISRLPWSLGLSRGSTVEWIARGSNTPKPGSSDPPNCLPGFTQMENQHFFYMRKSFFHSMSSTSMFDIRLPSKHWLLVPVFFYRALVELSEREGAKVTLIQDGVGRESCATFVPTTKNFI